MCVVRVTEDLCLSVSNKLILNGSVKIPGIYMCSGSV